MMITISIAVAAVVSMGAACPPSPVEMRPEYPANLEAMWKAGPGLDVDGKAGQTQPASGEDPALVGWWQEPILWEVIAIHAAVMHTGEVLHYSYPGEEPGSVARLWDPTTERFTDVGMNADLFCSGHSLLGDGSLYVTGGTGYECEQQGLRLTHQYDPVARTWTHIGNMSVGRYYPTNVTLGDGRVLIMSGTDETCELTGVMEIFTPGEGLAIVANGERTVEFYPRLHLLSSGLVAHVGIDQETWTFDPAGGGWEFVGFSNFGVRKQGTSVLLPDRTDQIMIIGGRDNDAGLGLTDTCEIIDFSEPKPEYHYTAPLNEARGHADAIILPDATVLLVGGGRQGLYNLPVLTPELFDPETEQWQVLAPNVHSRMYHATTVLLPDGRVLAAGQDDGDSMFFGEVYSPPYLFKGERPKIDAAPQRVGYGAPFAIATASSAKAIESVALIAPSTVTHSVNNHQRYVGLDFVATNDSQLVATGPEDGNHAPPGYYMLFIVDDQGIPSVAEFVLVADPITGDVNGDGQVDSIDLFQLLGAWGACDMCNACIADLDGDCVVGSTDLVLLLGNWSSQ